MSQVSQAGTSEGVKNVVLVHGGFVDGSGWQGVYDLLKKDGYNVSIVQNPTISLADDVAVTKRTLAAQNGPAILVGHSYGGVVITEAGNDPKVAGLVYIAAFAPDKGESVSALIKNPPPGAPVPRSCRRRTGISSSTGRSSASRSRRTSAGCRRVHGGFPSSVGTRGAQRRSQRTCVEDEAELVPRVDRRQDDSARRAARDVQARWLNRRRGQGQSRGLRVAAAGRRGDHHEGRTRRRANNAIGEGPFSTGVRFRGCPKFVYGLRTASRVVPGSNF